MKTKKILKNMKNCKWKSLIRSITKNSNYYDKKHMKTKFDSYDKLPLNKTIEILSMIIFPKATFLENNKYCPHVFLEECTKKCKNREYNWI